MTDSGAKSLSDVGRRGYLTRVLVVYLGASYAVLEITDIFIDQLGLPDWFFPGVITLLLFGLPIVVATALVQFRARGSVAEAAAPPETGLATDVGTRAEASDSVQAGAAEPARRPWLTWRKALVGFAAAFALWGLVVAGYMAMRALGIGPVGSLVAAGVMDERDRVILADFGNNTNDPLLGRAATEALRIDLSSSTIVTVVSGPAVDRVLVLMEADPEQPLDEGLAREVAIREGIEAVVAGDITQVGSGYVLTARLVGAQDGQVLAATRETARDSTAIIGAIDRLSKSLRSRVGESLKTIRDSEPLDQVTTASLEALRKYSLAQRIIEQGDHERAIGLLDEAVALDSAFAMAWRKLGVTLGNLNRDRAREIEALTKAYELRDKLSDRERYLTEGSYYQGVTGESGRAAAAYQSILDLYPGDTWAMNNLALIFFEDRDYRRAEQLFERALQTDSADALFYGNAIAAQAAIGDFGRAEETHRHLAEKFPEHPDALMDGVALATAQFDYGLAGERLRQSQLASSSNRMVQLALTFSAAQLAEVRGQLNEAERLLEQARLAFEQQEELGAALATTVRIAFYDLMLRGQVDTAVERVEAALTQYPLDEMDAFDRPYETLALFYALAEQDVKSRAMLAAAEAVGDPNDSHDQDPDGDYARAVLAINSGDTDAAIRHTKLADVGPCSTCSMPVLGHVYDAGGQTDSVVAVYERYLETPWLYRLASTDWWALAGIYERLGGVYELRGDTERALFYYNQLVELWKDADAELQPRVEAAQRAIERLRAEPAVGS